MMDLFGLGENNLCICVWLFYEWVVLGKLFDDVVISVMFDFEYGECWEYGVCLL